MRAAHQTYGRLRCMRGKGKIQLEATRLPGDSTVQTRAFGLGKTEASRKQRERGQPASQCVEVPESVEFHKVQSGLQAAGPALAEIKWGVPADFKWALDRARD